MRHVWWLALAVALMPAGCESGPPVVEVTLTEWSVTLSPQTVRAGTVRYNVVNRGAEPHGFAIEGQGLEQIVPLGGSTTRETLTPAGGWQVFCQLPGHRDRGMRAELDVR